MVPEREKDRRAPRRFFVIGWGLALATGFLTWYWAGEMFDKNALRPR